MVRRIALSLAAMVSFELPAAPPGEDEQAHQAAIDAFYPVMIEAVNQGRLGAARELCEKAIAWQPRNPVHFYNLACIESKAGDVGRAFEALHQALSLGYADVKSLQTDPDLAGLRGTQSFSDMLRLAADNTRNQPGGGPGQPPASAAAQPARSAVPLSAQLEPEAAPAQARLTANGPVGLFFMTRYWMATRSLEKAVWYFAPDGTAYENPSGGFSAAELAAHPGRKGTIRLEGEKLILAVTGGRGAGKASYGRYEPNPAETSFYWDMGSFIPVQGFKAGASVAGVYEGGFSSGSGSTSGSVARTLTLRDDGTFSLTGAASVSATSRESRASGGASGSLSSGTWKTSTYSLTLTDTSGRAKRAVAFPWDDEKTPVYPDQFYFDGIMWKRRN